MWGNGSYEPGNSEAGTPAGREVNRITQSCFVMEIQGLAKPTLGNTSKPLGAEEKWQVLTRYNVSSIVIENLCNQAKGRSVTVACFYFDFAAQNEQSPTIVLGSLLKQLVFGLEEIPEDVLEAYGDRRNAIGGQEPQISDILKMLQTTSARSARSYASTLSMNAQQNTRSNFSISWVNYSGSPRALEYL